jgi:hypothetical protein
VLVVMTFRPEFQAPWTGQAGVTLIALSRLEQADAAQLAAQVTLDQVLPPALLARIVAQAEGAAVHRGADQGGAGEPVDGGCGGGGDRRAGDVAGVADGAT